MFLLLCAFFVGAGGYILSNLKSTYELQYGVAKIDELAIKSSPGAAGIELFKISKGTPVIITAEAGPYFKIKMPQLKSGKKSPKRLGVKGYSVQLLENLQNLHKSYFRCPKLSRFLLKNRHYYGGLSLFI